MYLFFNQYHQPYYLQPCRKEHFPFTEICMHETQVKHCRSWYSAHRTNCSNLYDSSANVNYFKIKGIEEIISLVFSVQSQVDVALVKVTSGDYLIVSILRRTTYNHDGPEQKNTRQLYSRISATLNFQTRQLDHLLSKQISASKDELT